MKINQRADLKGIGALAELKSGDQVLVDASPKRGRLEKPPFFLWIVNVVFG